MPSSLPGTYTLDSETLKLNAYRLLCLFYANKEIARLSDPNDPDDAAVHLEKRFFSREMTQLLLAIAVGLRVLDDQMRALPLENEHRKAYLARREQVNRRHVCMMFDGMPLREVCNKIIHAIVVEPHSTEGSASHKIDEHNWLAWSEVHNMSPEEAGPEPEPIKWEHLSGHIRLGGHHDKEQWWHLLEVPMFAEAVYELLDAGGHTNSIL
jgi:hypothetical protein